jgi:serine/threonine protein kinase
MPGADPSDLTLYAESTWMSPWVFHTMVALEEKQLPYRLEVVPLELQRIIRRCLEKNPEARFQSARDLAFALRGVFGVFLGHFAFQQARARGHFQRIA